MYLPQNMQSGLTTSTETKTIGINYSTSSYVKQTEFSTTIKSLMEDFKKEFNNIAAAMIDQYEIFDNI